MGGLRGWWRCRGGGQGVSLRTIRGVEEPLLRWYQISPLAEFTYRRPAIGCFEASVPSAVDIEFAFRGVPFPTSAWDAIISDVSVNPRGDLTADVPCFKAIIPDGQQFIGGANKPVVVREILTLWLRVYPELQFPGLRPFPDAMLIEELAHMLWANTNWPGRYNGRRWVSHV